MTQGTKERVELHLHTQYSPMDALISPAEAVVQAKAWGHPAVAITDHDGVRAFPEAMMAAERYGMKVIYGMEISYWDDALREYHQTILVRDRVGLRNLYRLVSRGAMDSVGDGRLTVSRATLDAHREGLLFGSACSSGELVCALLEGRSEEALARVVARLDYLELQPVVCYRDRIGKGLLSSEEEIRALHRRIVALGERYGKPVVATCDAHALRSEDERCRRILWQGRACGEGFYLRTTEEMLTEFSHLGAQKAYEVVVEAPNRINECIREIRPIPEGRYEPCVEGAEAELRALCEARAHALYGDPLPEVVESRLRTELALIEGNGYASRYQIARSIVELLTALGAPVSARGGVGASLVAYLSGICEINPLPPHVRCACGYSVFAEDGDVASGLDLPDAPCPRCGGTMRGDGHDLPYQTFLGFWGDRVPDMDLTVSCGTQVAVVDALKERFGETHVFAAGMERRLFRRRAYGLVRTYAEAQGLSLTEEEMAVLAERCEGVLCGTTLHPGGIVLIPKECDVYDFTPVHCEKGGACLSTHFSWHHLQHALLKVDVLEYRGLNMLMRLRRMTGQEPTEVPLNDPRVWALFAEGDTVGLPNVGSPFLRGMLRQTKPQSVSDLLKVVGLSHGTGTWRGNAETLLREGACALAETIAFRDDVMAFLTSRGMAQRDAFLIMERVRKGRGVSDEEEAAMLAAGVPAWYVASCRRIHYLFPKAHAVSYVLLALRLAWYRVYEPLAFACAYWTEYACSSDVERMLGGVDAVLAEPTEVEEWSDVDVTGVLRWCVERGIRFLPPDAERSHGTDFLPEDGAIRLPLCLRSSEDGADEAC